MGQTTEQLETEIGQAREELQSNLQELESRARDAVDWRGYFKKYPGPMLAAAVVAGAALSLMTGKR